MSKIIGRNAYVYVSGIEMPNRNQVTINFNREMQEARTFQPDVPGGPWSEQIPGFRNFTININGYYDEDTDVGDIPFDLMNAVNYVPFYVYENRTTTTRYWYGTAFFTVTEEIGVDNIITINLTGTGTGALGRKN